MTPVAAARAYNRVLAQRELTAQATDVGNSTAQFVNDKGPSQPGVNANWTPPTEKKPGEQPGVTTSPADAPSSTTPPGQLDPEVLAMLPGLASGFNSDGTVKTPEETAADQQTREVINQFPGVNSPATTYSATPELDHVPVLQQAPSGPDLTVADLVDRAAQGELVDNKPYQFPSGAGVVIQTSWPLDEKTTRHNEQWALVDGKQIDIPSWTVKNQGPHPEFGGIGWSAEIGPNLNLTRISIEDGQISTIGYDLSGLNRTVVLSDGSSYIVDAEGNRFDRNGNRLIEISGHLIPFDANGNVVVPDEDAGRVNPPEASLGSDGNWWVLPQSSGGKSMRLTEIEVPLGAPGKRYFRTDDNRVVVVDGRGQHWAYGGPGSRSILDAILDAASTLPISMAAFEAPVIVRGLPKSVRSADPAVGTAPPAPHPIPSVASSFPELPQSVTVFRGRNVEFPSANVPGVGRPVLAEPVPPISVPTVAPKMVQSPSEALEAYGAGPIYPGRGREALRPAVVTADGSISIATAGNNRILPATLGTQPSTAGKTGGKAPLPSARNITPSSVQAAFKELESAGPGAHSAQRHYGKSEQILLERLGVAKLVDDPIDPTRKIPRLNKTGFVATEKNIDPARPRPILLNDKRIYDDMYVTDRTGAPKKHNSGNFATTFKSKTAFVLAADWAEMLRRVEPSGSNKITFDISDVLGADGHLLMRGLYLDPLNPTRALPVDFKGGMIVAIFRIDLNGKPYLYTMYPNPTPGRHP